MTTRILITFALASLLAGCNAASLAIPTGPIDPDGSDFLSTSVVEDGAERPLVPGSQIRLSFADGSLGASAGCNHLGGEYRIEDGRLVVDAMGMTEMGCDPARHAQDDWLAQFLSSRPAFGLADGQLVLDNGVTRITFQDRRVAEPALPLVGTTWTLSSLIEGEAVKSVPEQVQAGIVFGADGNLSVEPGCNSGSADYEIIDGAVTVGPIALTRMLCEGAAGQIEADVLAVLGAGEIGYRIDSSMLTLEVGGRGLQFIGG